MSTTVGDVLTASPDHLRGDVYDELLRHVVTSSETDDKLEVRGEGGSPAV